MNRIGMSIKNNAAYTLFELLVVLVLIGYVSVSIISRYQTSQPEYSLRLQAHELKSSIQVQQAMAMQFFERKEYTNKEMRDDDLWGIAFPGDGSYQFIRKKAKSGSTDMLDKNSFPGAIPQPVWYDTDIYSSHKKNITYQLNNSCTGSEKILFDALGKPVNNKGKQCSRDIFIKLESTKTQKSARLVIKKTGLIDIQL